MPPVRKVRWLIVAALAALSGCTSARLVSRDPYGGVVAIPENSNRWPYFFHDKALELIKEECPDGYVIAKEEEAIVGTVLSDRESTDLYHAQEVRNQTEWRISYRKVGPVTTTVTPPLPRPQATLAGTILPVATLSPAPVPQ